jgi:diamine N-acetyltransferase
MNRITDGEIKLRALEPDDVELLYRWENDPMVWRVSNTHAPVSKFILASYIKSSDRDFWESKEMRLIIEDIEGKPVGTIELFDFDPFHLRAGLGIIVFENNDRRKGIANKALKLIMNYSLTELGIYQLYANIAESNRASLELFGNLGFIQTGNKTNWLRLPGVGWENELLLQRVLGY